MKIFFDTCKRRLKMLASQIAPHQYNKRWFFLVLFFVCVLGGFLLYTKYVSAEGEVFNGLIRFVSWMMLIVAQICIGLTIFFLRFFITLASYNNYIDVNVVMIGWVMVRDVANMFFVVALLIIAFATILGLEQYEWKKGLFKLVIAAIFINFSNLIAQLIIDAAHVFTITFLNAVSATAGGNLIHMFKLDQIVSMANSSDTKDWSGDIQLGVLAASIVACFFAILSAVALGAYVVVMAIRVTLLWALIILSPLAYILSVLPKTESYAQKWWSMFGKQVIVAPVMVFFLWLAFATLGTGDIINRIQGDNTIPLVEKSGVNVGQYVSVSQQAEATQTEPSISLSKVSSWENMANYIIALIFMFLGIQITQETGAVGAGIVGKAVDFGKKAATYATGYAAGRWLVKGAGKVAWKGIKTGAYYAPLVGGEKWKFFGKTVWANVKASYYRRSSGLTKTGIEASEDLARKRTELEAVQGELQKKNLPPEQQQKLKAREAALKSETKELEGVMKTEMSKGGVIGWFARRGVSAEKHMKKSEGQAETLQKIAFKRMGSEAGGWYFNKMKDQASAQDRRERGIYAGEEMRSKAKDEEYENLGKMGVLGAPRVKFKPSGKDDWAYQKTRGTVSDQIAKHKRASAGFDSIIKSMAGKADIRLDIKANKLYQAAQGNKEIMDVLLGRKQLDDGNRASLAETHRDLLQSLGLKQKDLKYDPAIAAMFYEKEAEAVAKEQKVGRETVAKTMDQGQVAAWNKYEQENKEFEQGQKDWSNAQAQGNEALQQFLDNNPIAKAIAEGKDGEMDKTTPEYEKAQKDLKAAQAQAKVTAQNAIAGNANAQKVASGWVPTRPLVETQWMRQAGADVALKGIEDYFKTTKKNTLRNKLSADALQQLDQQMAQVAPTTYQKSQLDTIAIQKRNKAGDVGALFDDKERLEDSLDQTSKQYDEINKQVEVAEKEAAANPQDTRLKERVARLQAFRNEVGQQLQDLNELDDETTGPAKIAALRAEADAAEAAAEEFEKNPKTVLAMAQEKEDVQKIENQKTKLLQTDPYAASVFYENKASQIETETKEQRARLTQQFAMSQVGRGIIEAIASAEVGAKIAEDFVKEIKNEKLGKEFQGANDEMKKLLSQGFNVKQLQQALRQGFYKVGSQNIKLGKFALVLGQEERATLADTAFNLRKRQAADTANDAFVNKPMYGVVKPSTVLAEYSDKNMAEYRKMERRRAMSMAMNVMSNMMVKRQKGEKLDIHQEAELNTALQFLSEEAWVDDGHEAIRGRLEGMKKKGIKNLTAEEKVLFDSFQAIGWVGVGKDSDGKDVIELKKQAKTYSRREAQDLQNLGASGGDVGLLRAHHRAEEIQENNNRDLKVERMNAANAKVDALVADGGEGKIIYDEVYQKSLEASAKAVEEKSMTQEQAQTKAVEDARIVVSAKFKDKIAEVTKEIDKKMMEYWDAIERAVREGDGIDGMHSARDVAARFEQYDDFLQSATRNNTQSGIKTGHGELMYNQNYDEQHGVHRFMTMEEAEGETFAEFVKYPPRDLLKKFQYHHYGTLDQETGVLDDFILSVINNTVGRAERAYDLTNTPDRTIKSWYYVHKTEDMETTSKRAMVEKRDQKGNVIINKETGKAEMEEKEFRYAVLGGNEALKKFAADGDVTSEQVERHMLARGVLKFALGGLHGWQLGLSKLGKHIDENEASSGIVRLEVVGKKYEKSSDLLKRLKELTTSTNAADVGAVKEALKGTKFDGNLEAAIKELERLQNEYRVKESNHRPGKKMPNPEVQEAALGGEG